jgi:hypothetical protein
MKDTQLRLQAEIGLLRNLKAKCEKEHATDNPAYRMICHELDYIERVHYLLYARDAA